jgi:hypothetical protein
LFASGLRFPYPVLKPLARFCLRTCLQSLTDYNRLLGWV